MELFGDRLLAAVRARRTPVLVGLDPRLEQLPPLLVPAQVDPVARAAAYVTFCREVIDVVAPLVPAVKPQAAFFEQLGPPGMAALGEVMVHARRAGLLVILDGKRNDIGSTAEAYAEGYLGADSAWGADALTVSPYLGSDSLTPFVDVAAQRGAGVFVLVKTSNPGGGQFQDLLAKQTASQHEHEAAPVFEHVARAVEQLAVQTVGQGGYGAVGAVVGATYPRQLAELRAQLPHSWLLVPGFGHQGGAAADVAGAFDACGAGALVNNSRGIIFAHARPEYAARFGAARWQDAVAAATRDMIEQLRTETLAGKL